jgi:hypothetical protein
MRRDLDQTAIGAEVAAKRVAVFEATRTSRCPLCAQWVRPGEQLMWLPRMRTGLHLECGVAIELDRIELNAAPIERLNRAPIEAPSREDVRQGLAAVLAAIAETG